MTTYLPIAIHPILPFLVAPFYYLEIETDNQQPEDLPQVAKEISILLTRLQIIVNDLQAV